MHAFSNLSAIFPLLIGFRVNNVQGLPRRPR